MGRRGVRRIVLVVSLSAFLLLSLALLITTTGLLLAGCGSPVSSPTPTPAPTPTPSPLPGLLRQDFSSFAVRPATIGFGVDGGAVMGRFRQHGASIHWREWTTGDAYGTGTLWIDNGIPDMAAGTYDGYSATAHAYRVRDGRFTRMTVSYHQSGQQKTWALTLHRLSTGWTW